MPGHECHHCKQWVEEDEAHDCWTTTEAALTADLSEDLKDAWERLRETAVEFGEQRVYASHHSIMFSRKVCYFFVRPKTKYLEVWVMLGRAVKAPQVRSVMKGSSAKFANAIRITHRDEVEPPITDWLREAYDQHDALIGKNNRRKAPKNSAKTSVKNRPTKKRIASAPNRARGASRTRRAPS
jgi:hypothetical protein